MPRLILILALFLPLSVSAQYRFEALGGECQYGKAGNFIWYNEQYPHALDLTPRCGLLAVSKVTMLENGLQLGWRVAYVDLGSARTNAVFPMHDSEQSLAKESLRCDPATLHGCLGRGVGMQTARGFTFGYLAEHEFAAFTLGAEAGAYVYEGRWRVNVQPEPPSSFAPVSFDWSGYQAT
ncbi:MAG: hypothetical protein WBM00_05675, partial [Solirubrobacterales bacterium]